MKISGLVIGFGSIGRRHVEILNSMEEIDEVSILSSQCDLPYNNISSLKNIPELNPDYVVIASPTNQHELHLRFLEEHLRGKKVLVEKPLFDSNIDLKVLSNEVFVGYNLRFHPLLNKVREICLGKRLWSINVFCGSYLPDWRPDKDYRMTYSVKKNSGGGVLMDLSHEFDYVSWLAGPMVVDHVIYKKVSNLQIESKDLLHFSGKTQSGAYVQITLNYFTRDPIRQIIIDGEGISIQGDLIANTLTVTLKNIQIFMDGLRAQRNLS